MSRSDRAASTPDAAALDALFAPLADARALLLAVSGGPDSTALLLLAQEWAARRGGPRLEAATVDHGLREASANEARDVAALCAQLGAPHHLLKWVSARPGARLQERAREARYDLLCRCAKDIGAEAVLTAHHADDQAETVLFRLTRGSGIAGLSGMATTTRRHGVAIARPLLGLSKRDLEAVCEARGVRFVRDPSNDDPRYARARLRAALPALEALGLGPPALLRLARRAGEADEALSRAASAVLARLSQGDAAIDAKTLFAEPIAVVQRVLAAQIAAAGGGDKARVELEKVEALTQALRAATAQGRRYSANVGGVLARLSGKGALRLTPEPPRRPTQTIAKPRRIR